MAFAKKILVFFFLLTIVFGTSNGTVYKVGDSAGWTNNGVDYKSWAASKDFQVGDVISFEYNKQFHNVVRVTHKNFNSCNATSPYETFNSGYDSFTIKRSGHYYFICSFGDHCRDGQRVDIRVVRSVQPPCFPPSPAPYVPVPVPVEPPYVPAPVPSESPNVPVPAPGPDEPPYVPVHGAPNPDSSLAPYVPAPAPSANSGISKYPKLIGLTIFLASVFIGNDRFRIF